MIKNGALKKRAQYMTVYEAGITKLDKYLVLRALANNLPYSRFGYSINKKLGKAVVRNHVKRLLKEITRILGVKPGFDIVLIARSDAAKADYHELEKSVRQLFYRANLLELENEKISAVVN